MTAGDSNSGSATAKIAIADTGVATITLSANGTANDTYTCTVGGNTLTLTIKAASTLAFGS